MYKSLIQSLSKNINQLCAINQFCQPSKRLGIAAPAAKTMGKETSIVWMDLEMTGLDIEKDKIMELACLITDKDLNVIAEGPTVAIFQPDEVLENMNEWCMKHHYETKLVDKCKSSNISIERADDIVLQFLQNNIPMGKCPLGGNSVYMDRMFLHKHMPKVNNYMHYRIIDVSTIKEVCVRWNPSIAAGAPKKKLVHRSLDDIKESIAELRYYKKFIFK